jgi:hypothetical protein
MRGGGENRGDLGTPRLGALGDGGGITAASEDDPTYLE